MKLFNALVFAGVAFGVRVYNGASVQDDINRCADDLMVSDKLCTGLSIPCYLEYLETVCHGKICFDKPNPDYLKECNYLRNEDDVEDDSYDLPDIPRNCEFKNMCDMLGENNTDARNDQSRDVKEETTNSEVTSKHNDVKGEVTESKSTLKNSGIKEGASESESDTSGSAKNIGAFSLTMLAIAHLITL